MKTLEQMKQDGIDVDGAMERFLGNEALFRKFLGKLQYEETYDLLCQAISDSDVNEAFHYAHTMKGVLGNLSITDAYHAIYEITECLRDGEFPSKEQWTHFMCLYEKWIDYLRTIDEE